MLLLAGSERWQHRGYDAGEGEGALGEASWGECMSAQPTWPRCNICGLELIPGHTWSESPTAQRDRLRAELTAETRRAEDAHGEAQRWAMQVETLRAEKAELVAALLALADNAEGDMRMNQGGDDHEGEPESSGGWWSSGTAEAIVKARAALAKATATEGGE
jgi:hypothetical protein